MDLLFKSPFFKKEKFSLGFLPFLLPFEAHFVLYCRLVDVLIHKSVQWLNPVCIGSAFVYCMHFNLIYICNVFLYIVLKL